MEVEDKYFLDTLGIYISLKKMSEISDIALNKLVKLAKNGYLVTKGNLTPIEDNYEEYINEPIVPLSECQDDVIIDYLRKMICSNKYLDLDFKSYEIRYGRNALKELEEAILAIKEIENRSVEYYDEPAKLVQKLFAKYGIKKRKYHDILSEMKKGQISKLINDKPSFHKTICPLAKNYILEMTFRPEEPTHEEILEDLILLKEKEGKDICGHCPFKEGTAEHESAKNEIEEKYDTFPLTSCLHEPEGLIIPEDRSTIERFIKECSKTTIYYAEHDRHMWLMNQGHQVVRKKPTKINEVAFSDHHMIDMFVLVGYTKDGQMVLAKPWVTVQMDTASGMITSSVVSLSPNKYTIAECFARSACITHDNPCYGLPKVLYIDRGSDYKSYYIIGDKEVEAKTNDVGINRFFFDDPFLKCLNVEIIQARRKSPQTKPIERMFGTIEVKYIRKLPGYVGGKKARKFKEKRKQELDRLIRSGKIWTLDKFVEYWFSVVIPRFNNLSVRGKKSPLEKYHSLERENTLTPSWNVMSIYMQEKRKVKVTQQGIKYKKRFYYSPILDDYLNKDVLIFDFYDPYTKFVIVYYINKNEGINKYLGIATVVEELEYADGKSLSYERNMAYVHKQEKMAKKHIQLVRYLSQLANISKKSYVDFKPEIRDTLVTYYAEEIEESNTPTQIDESEITIDILKALKDKKEKEKAELEELIKIKSNSN